MIVVQGRRGAFRIREDQGEAHVEAELGGSWMDLGADSHHVVLGRLREALAERRPTDGASPEGGPPAWVMGLSSPHGSIYLGRTAEGVAVFLHHGDGDMVARVELDADAVTKLERELDEALEAR